VQALLQYTVSSCADARSQGSTQQQQQASFDPFLHEQELAAALHVGEGFDSEQVWLQLDMQLAPLRKRLRKLLSQIDGSSDAAAGAAAAAGLRLVPVEVEEGIDAVLDGSDTDGGSGSEGDEGFEEGDDGDEEMLGSDLQEGDGEEEDGQQGTAAAAAAGGHRKPLPTEDRWVGEV
jgi:hypothetical protein